MKPTILFIALCTTLATTLTVQAQQPPSAVQRTSRAAKVNYSVSQVTITDCFCIMPADRLVDELKLVVTVDGVTRKTVQKTVRKGSTWQFSPPLQFNFSQEVTVKLYELDQPDTEDFLGAISILPQATSRGRQYFRGGGAEYLLQYDVTAP